MLQRFLAVRSAEVTGRGAEQAQLREPQSPHTPTTPPGSSCVSLSPPLPPHSLNREGELGGRVLWWLAAGRQVRAFVDKRSWGGGSKSLKTQPESNRQ